MSGFSMDTRFGRGAQRAAMLAGALCLTMPLVGCLGYDGTINRGYLAANAGLDKVNPGMPAEQVLSTLGTPSTTSTVGGDAWYYISQRLERKVRFMNPIGHRSARHRRLFQQAEEGRAARQLRARRRTGRRRPQPHDAHGGGETNFVRQMLTGLLKFS